MTLSTCEICGEVESPITKCKTCGRKFCEYCGSDEDTLCIECLEYYDDEYKDDEEDWR
jgi:hypothetical protein